MKYFKENLKYEAKNCKNIISISENLQTIDPNFPENIAEYKKYFNLFSVFAYNLLKI